MEIRALMPEDDLLDVSNIYECSWKHAYKNIVPQSFLESIPKGRWAGRITRKGMNNLLLVEDGIFAGTACYCRSRWEKYSDYGEIATIYLMPEFTRKGHGTLLLSKCIEELKGLGFKNVLIWVLEDNFAARRFYEKLGFRLSEEYMDDNIGGKNLREIMYTYEIK